MVDTLLGLDIGSSSVKASLLDAATGKVLASATSPTDRELPIEAPKPGWAEQHPDSWWEHVGHAVRHLGQNSTVPLSTIKAVGIAYQMHGLVLLDQKGKPVRPAIIWCDSRAVDVGAEAFQALGRDRCLQNLGNSPGNFTASKLAWVKRHEPEVFSQAACMMLPGDYIALRLTGERGTTFSGLSEGVLWNFSDEAPAHFLLEYFGISPSLLAPATPCFNPFASVRSEAAAELGIPAGIPVSYRAGDQPNNALALNALEPGEVAANAGTSGVVYGVSSAPAIDPRSRVNNFLHVNHTHAAPRAGILMCVNGTGAMYRWMRQVVGGADYAHLNALAAESPIGARGVTVIPYGNGAERTLDNRTPGASINYLDLNRHSVGDLVRATQEGIVFALTYGLEIIRGMGFNPTRVRAGAANMFQSALFREAFACSTKLPVELFHTDGSEGAARGAGIGAGLFSAHEAFRGLNRSHVIEPDAERLSAYADSYSRWKETVTRVIGE